MHLAPICPRSFVFPLVPFHYLKPKPVQDLAADRTAPQRIRQQLPSHADLPSYIRLRAVCYPLLEFISYLFPRVKSHAGMVHEKSNM